MRHDWTDIEIDKLASRVYTTAEQVRNLRNNWLIAIIALAIGILIGRMR